MLYVVGLVVGIVFLIFAFRLVYFVCCMLFLPPGHPRNVAARRERWQEQHPGKKHPFRF